MVYKLYIEFDEIEKIDNIDYDDMKFCLDYLIRVRGFKNKILVIQHDIINDNDEVFYLYNGDVDEYINDNINNVLIKRK